MYTVALNFHILTWLEQPFFRPIDWKNLHALMKKGEWYQENHLVHISASLLPDQRNHRKEENIFPNKNEY